MKNIVLVYINTNWRPHQTLEFSICIEIDFKSLNLNNIFSIYICSNSFINIISIINGQSEKITICVGESRINRTYLWFSIRIQLFSYCEFISILWYLVANCIFLIQTTPMLNKDYFSNSKKKLDFTEKFMNWGNKLKFMSISSIDTVWSGWKSFFWLKVLVIVFIDYVETMLSLFIVWYGSGVDRRDEMYLKIILQHATWAPYCNYLKYKNVVDDDWSIASTTEETPNLTKCLTREKKKFIITNVYNLYQVHSQRGGESEKISIDHTITWC